MKNKIIIIITLLCLTSITMFLIINRDVSIFEKNANLSDIEFNNKVNIYIFWGEGCPHCEELFVYLESIRKDYDKYFNVYGFEVFNNKENQNIMDSFKEELNGTVGKYSVPYIIIGDKVLEGFNSSMKDEVLNTLLKEYESLEDINKFKNIIK